MRLLKLAALLLIVLLITREVSAEYVPVSFRDNGRVINARGETLHGARGARYYFSDVALGGTCGDKQAAFKRGDTWNNALSDGDVCFATAKLHRRSDRRVMRGRRVSVVNDDGTVRAAGTTDSQGKVVLNWTVLAGGGAPAYTLKGPSVRPGKFLGCLVYFFDHLV